jgi:hypothetical protein
MERILFVTLTVAPVITALCGIRRFIMLDKNPPIFHLWGHFIPSTSSHPIYREPVLILRPS